MDNIQYIYVDKINATAIAIINYLRTFLSGEGGGLNPIRRF